MGSEKVLGINSLGRIGKLSLWHHVNRKYFDRIVVNTGREVGKDLEALCGSIEKDTTYGRLHHFLKGRNAKRCIQIVDREKGDLSIDGVPVRMLLKQRNPAEVEWAENGVSIVVECSGAFNDPTSSVSGGRGSIRGHLAAGARKVMNSADFKPKEKGTTMPDDAVVLIYGVNHEAYDPSRHDLISAASCTTTALAHMMKGLLDEYAVESLLTASMSTIHATTNTQSVLDNVPKTGAGDLRKNRSILNNIILTSTNAGAALEKVIPTIREIGFMADSVRVPTTTASLIILNVTFRSTVDDDGNPNVTRSILQSLFKKASRTTQKDLLEYSDEQNVSSDMIGRDAAVVIEGHDTHTRTGFVTLDLATIPGMSDEALALLPDPIVHVPVTHAKIFGWYDNEYGSYTNRLADLTVHVASHLD